MHSKNFKKINNTAWGTEETYFPFIARPTRFTKEDLERSRMLTPSQRGEWLIMLQRLLIEHFQRRK